MTTRKRMSLWAATALAAASLYSASLHSVEPGAEARPTRARLIARVKKELALTDEQMAKVREILAGEKDTLKRLAQEVHQGRTGLREAVNAPNSTEASVRAAAQKLASAQSDFAVERWQLHGKISPVLTEEQRAKVKEFHAKIDHWVENAIDRMGEPQP